MTVKQKFRDRYRKEYAKLMEKPVFCPVLNENVFFTTDGWKHLIYKPNGKDRKINEQYLKLCNLKYASYVIVNATGIDKETVTENDKGKEIRVTAIISQPSKDEKIKVILQKVGAGRITFRSVMPLRHHNKKKKHL